MSMMSDTADEISTADSGKSPEDTVPAPNSDTPKPVEWEELFEVTSIADLFSTHRGDPMARSMRMGDGALSFKGSNAGVSRRSAAARAGQTFRATTTVNVEGEGDESPVQFGPIFLDARDEIIFYSPQIPVKALGEEQEVEVDFIAPPGTVSVRLRMVGAWAPDKDTSKLFTSYGPATLYRMKV